jgi:hypothetical protein
VKVWAERLPGWIDATEVHDDGLAERAFMVAI